MSGRHARAIMLQGTGSHAGKTVLVAGLCRLLARRGLRVRPFKSQNMSLNASVAPDGGEMGWAQVMQAEAAGVPARVEMNPILLKPRAAARSQVVLLGRVLREADAVGYYRLTLANMRVARLARAPVLLVGDIDRGGVFASLLGTTGATPRSRRPRCAISSAATRVPVVGVVPFRPRLGLPEEDSVALDAAAPAARGGLRVAVVRLPHIANFTDFAPLAAEPGVELVYAAEPAALAGAALVVLPGSPRGAPCPRRPCAGRVRGLPDARPRLVSARKFFAPSRAGGYHSLSPPRAAAAFSVFEDHRSSDGRIEARARRRRVARTHRGAVGDPA